MSNLSSRPRPGGRRRSRTVPADRRVQVVLLAGVAVVVVVLVTTTVVVLTGRARAGAPVARDGCSAMTQPVRYHVDPDHQTGLFTTSVSAASSATDAGYTRDEGVLFRASVEPAPGLVGVHQLRKGAGDQLWSIDATEIREAAKGSGYLDQGVVAYVSPVPGPCTVQVQRFQKRGVHRYAATTNQREALRSAGWTPEGSFYAAGPGDGGSTPTASPTPSPRPSPTPGGGDAPRTVIDARFDGVPSGRVTPDSFIQALGGTNHDPAAYDSMTFVQQGDGSGSQFVRTHLAADRILSRTSARGDGNVLVVPLEDQSEDAACIAYDVRFSAGFEVSAGGKLPGLLGVAPGVPPGSPTGGGSTKHGWSGRVMWLGPKLSRAVRATGQPDLGITYLYHPGQAGTYGDEITWSRGLIDGGWHQVRQCYTLNTVGRADGVLQAWVDGGEVLSRADLVYRTDPAVHITHLDWSVFRGGDNDDWAASTAGDVDLDNLLVTVG